jgi:uncharacterized protein (DUF2141 family)
MLRFAIFCLAPLTLVAQDTSLTLAGSAVDSQSGQPLARALISITGFPVRRQMIGTPVQPVMRSTLTDSGGAFRFSALPAARYTLRAEKPGYTLATAGPSNFVDLQSSTEGIRINLSPLGVISGKVVDENGEPMRGVGINALSVKVQDGLRQTNSERNVRTDDRGEYRLWNLSPGKYYLRAVGQGGVNMLTATGNAARVELGDSFAPVYFGGGRTLDSANPVEVRSGTQATADFRLKLEPAFEVRGELRNYDPREAISFAMVINGEEVSVGLDRFNRETGAFVIQDVVSGNYVLRAFQANSVGEALFRVSEADVVNVAVALSPPVDIPIRVRYTNPEPATEKSPVIDDDERVPNCTASLIEELPDASARVAHPVSPEDGYLRNVVPGNHRVLIGCFGAYVRSALAGTQDLLAVPVLTVSPDSPAPSIEILATHGGGALTVKTNSALIHSTQFQVLLVPQFAASSGPQHREGFARNPGSTNEFNFEFSNLAPGTYAVYAFGNQENEFRNPAFLRTLSGGQTVEIEDDSNKVITIEKVNP